jgi:hypothetical protein
LVKTIRTNVLICDASDLSRFDSKNDQITEATVFGYSLNIKRLVSHYPNLEKLEITETNWDGLQLIKKSLPNLQQLVLRSCKELTRQEIEGFAKQLASIFYFSASLASTSRFYMTFNKPSGSDQGDWKEIFIQ